MRDAAGGADDAAHFIERTDLAARPRLHEHVSEDGRLDRAGEDGTGAGIGGELIEQGVARAAADDVDDFDALAGEFFDPADDGSIQ